MTDAAAHPHAVGPGGERSSLASPGLASDFSLELAPPASGTEWVRELDGTWYERVGSRMFPLREGAWS